MPPAPSNMPPLNRWSSAWRYLLVAFVALIGWSSALGSWPPPHDGVLFFYFLTIDPALGLLATVMLRWRRAYPLPIALSIAAISAVSSAAAGAALLSLGSVVTQKKPREITAALIANLVAAGVVDALYPRIDVSGPWWLLALLVVAGLAVVTAMGLAIGSRRELLISLQEKAETAVREQQARVAQAAAAERTRIAREMHDVLAHRISLVAMHAGALNFRTDLTPEQVQAAAATIESNAHEALKDLREVLGVLRQTGDDTTSATAVPEPPQPDLTELPRLIEETEELGVRISYAGDDLGKVPKSLGRTAYRIVQEALTNARKHAYGTAVTVTVRGHQDRGLTVTVRNARSLRAQPTTMPASGLGLLGLQERIALVGGTLTHGSDADGGYTLSAWLPWPS